MNTRAILQARMSSIWLPSKGVCQLNAVLMIGLLLNSLSKGEESKTKHIHKPIVAWISIIKNKTYLIRTQFSRHLLGS
jgi:spore coat polysaccharide biosynthesis protein SpsF (cytidylyltransferase family)